MEGTKSKVIYGLHKGDSYYMLVNSRQGEGWCCQKCHVLQEPQKEIDKNGISILKILQENVECLFYYKDVNGRFHVYKSQKISEQREITVKEDSSFNCYANNPFECSIEEVKKIVLFQNDDNECVSEDFDLKRLLKHRGIYDYVEAVDKKDMPVQVESPQDLRRRRVKLAAIILASFLLFYFFPNWFVGCLIVLIDGLSLLIYSIWNASFDEGNYKTKRADMIKAILEYDFGDDFKLLARGGHDHEDYLFLLSNDSFESLRNYLDSIPDGDFKGKGSIKHNVDDNIGFSLSADRLKNDGCGNKEGIEVDYKNKLLHYSFTVF